MPRSFLLPILLMLLATTAYANSTNNNNNNNSDSYSSLPSARVSIVPDGSAVNLAQRFFQGADYHNFQQYQSGRAFDIEQDVEDAAGSRKP